MKKKIFLGRSLLVVFTILIGVMSPNPACAQTQRLVVWQTDGQKTYFDLEDNPKTTFEGENLVIATSNMVFTYPRNQILRYTYELVTSGIENTEVVTPVYVRQQPDALVLEHLKSGAVVQLFSIDGRLLMSQTAYSSSLTVSLSPYPSGVYIVKVNNFTCKMVKP